MYGPESVSSFGRNQCPVCSGIRKREDVWLRTQLRPCRMTENDRRETQARSRGSGVVAGARRIHARGTRERRVCLDAQPRTHDSRELSDHRARRPATRRQVEVPRARFARAARPLPWPVPGTSPLVAFVEPKRGSLACVCGAPHRWVNYTSRQATACSTRNRQRRSTSYTPNRSTEASSVTPPKGSSHRGSLLLRKSAKHDRINAPNE